MNVCSIKIYVFEMCARAEFCIARCVYVSFFFSISKHQLLFLLFLLYLPWIVGRELVLNGTENIQIIINLQPIFSTCTQFLQLFSYRIIHQCEQQEKKKRHRHKHCIEINKTSTTNNHEKETLFFSCILKRHTVQVSKGNKMQIKKEKKKCSSDVRLM